MPGTALLSIPTTSRACPIHPMAPRLTEPNQDLELHPIISICCFGATCLPHTFTRSARFFGLTQRPAQRLCEKFILGRHDSVSSELQRCPAMFLMSEHSARNLS